MYILNIAKTIKKLSMKSESYYSVNRLKKKDFIVACKQVNGKNT